ncbi:MAG: hypothetical protein HC825_00930 [Oscillatoriales cyanobacterium RM1_1_9]|nr:hypothetical protein [Oscillatoriales cyanobacterium RM1_1_9]
MGNRVELLGARVDASGNGGGTIRIGGDYKGSGILPNSAQTVIDQNSFIQADGLQFGDGGTVIVWSEEYTQIGGQISVRGA